MKQIETDILVIGAGSGGLSVAAGAVQMGARVVLLEAADMGGDCLNTGCVPSKSLLAASKHARRSDPGFGVQTAPAQVDFAAVQAHVRAVIDGIAPHDSQERFEGLGVTVIRAFGRFVSEREVEAADTRIRARRVIIATGSSPAVPPIPGLSEVPYLTNETIFTLTQCPAHLLIIGGGAIGMEMAQAHRRLGADVTVIEAGRCLGREDPEAAELVTRSLRQDGATLMEDTSVTQIHGGDGITVELGNGGVVRGSHLLVATGRRPNTDGLNLEAAGITATAGGIAVDSRLRTSNRRVFAIGDVIGGAGFTHLAGYHAGVIIRQAVLGLPARCRTDHIPHVTYTSPELAQIGPTEAQACETHGDRLQVIRLDYTDNDRARAERCTAGLIKLMVVKGRPVGVTIAGAQAGELIAVWALAVTNKLKLSQVAGMVLPYPTLGELNKRAAGAYFSPKLFESPMIKRIVKCVQRWLP